MNKVLFERIVNQLAENAYEEYAKVCHTTQDTDDAEAELDALVQGLRPEWGTKFKIGEAVLDICCAYESQGFLAGYKKAMELLNDGTMQS